MNYARRTEFEHEMTNRELLAALLDETKYRIDDEKGEIYSTHTGNPLYRTQPKRGDGTREGEQGDYVRITYKGKRRHVSVCRCIWMYSRRCVVPRKCEIHHANEYHDDNHWENLVCIHKKDHHLVHKLLSGSAPF